jgi:poly(A) polymerase
MRNHGRPQSRAASPRVVKNTPPVIEPKIYDASQHCIDEALVDPDALQVVVKLREAGFLAYIVGGGVRDLLLGIAPKDFDISTSAQPEDVKRIFGRSCLLIGRRFRLAHVRFGHKVIEVATFRSGENDSDLIVHDNQWGTPEEDVLRRDFTINGLFYDPQRRIVIDYVDGWQDVQARLLRTIGDPFMRFKQDPVRMIRLLKFQARLGFNVDSACETSLLRCRDEILKSAPARILEEMFRMLESGSAAPFFQLMVKTGLLELLFPCLDHFLQGSQGQQVYNMLACADVQHSQDRKRLYDRTVLTACLLYPILQEEIKAYRSHKGEFPHMGDILMLTNDIVQGVVIASFSNFPRRMSATLSFVLSTQYRLTPLTGKRHHRSKILQNKEFREAMEFFKLRSLVDATLKSEYQHWYQLYRQQERHSEKRSNHYTPHAHTPS